MGCRSSTYGIKDPTDIIEVKSAVEQWIYSLADRELEVFVSPGTPTMQTVWYLMSRELKHKARYFKTSSKRFRTTEKVEPKYLHVDETDYSKSIVINKAFEDTLSANDIYRPQKLEEVYKKAMHISRINDASVLIHGESGTGKESVVDYIHDNSDRRSDGIVKLNCGAFKSDLLESRLFGYAAGAFTGANEDRKGAFQMANGGTLFLDEIGEMSVEMQLTLLRVLEEKVVYKLGSYEGEPVDVRIIGATHKDLWELVDKGEFREDLLYRLTIAELKMPSFRSFEKKEKITFIDFFVAQTADVWGKSPIKLSSEVYNFLVDYAFPGNIRELQNLIRGLYTLEAEGEIGLTDLPERIHRRSKRASLKLVEVGNRHIEKVLATFHGNKKRAAEELGMSYPGLLKRIQKHNLKEGRI
jgi:two-component system response regulator HydG